MEAVQDRDHTREYHEEDEEHFGKEVYLVFQEAHLGLWQLGIHLSSRLSTGVGDKTNDVALGGENSVSPHGLLEAESFFLLKAGLLVEVSEQSSELIDFLVGLLAEKAVLRELGHISHFLYAFLSDRERAARFPIGLTVKLVSSNKDGV